MLQEVSILGKKKVDFPDQKTGQQVKGVRLYYCCTDPAIEGMFCGSIYADAGRMPELYKMISGIKLGEDPVEAKFDYVFSPSSGKNDVANIIFD